MYKCPYCPCVFETERDLNEHIKAFGTDAKTHAMKVRQAHIEGEQRRRFF
jgi:uncharacterized C2H2 Zn-finger protein